MKEASFELNILWIGLSIVFLILTLVHSFGWFFLLLLVALFVGIHHVLASGYFWVMYNFRSPLKYHTAGTVLYAAFMLTLFCNDFNWEKLNGLTYFMLYGTPILLAIHFWYITFTKLNPYRK